MDPGTDRPSRSFSLETDDPEKVAEGLRAVNPRGRFRRLGRLPFHFEAKAASLPRTGLFVTHTRNVWASDSSPRPLYYLTVPLKGTLRISDGRSTDDYSPGESHLLHKEDPLELQAPGDQACMILNADHELVESLARRLCSRGPVLSRFHGRFSLETPQGACFWRHLSFVWRELERSDALLKSPIAWREMEDALLATLLIALRPDMQRSEPDCPNLALRCAEEYLAAHIADAVSVSDVAEAAGISISTLFRAFQRRHGQGPMAFLRSRRLHAVHRALLASDHPLVTVARLALQYGFHHLGRFAAAYRAEFGESPGETLRRRSGFREASRGLTRR